MPLSFHTEQWLSHSPERVFAFFANPANLPRLMPAWQKARIEEIALVPPRRLTAHLIAAGAGSRLKLSFRLFPYSPIRIFWLAEIGEFAWNERFCDVQIRGPFAYWKHCHSVRAESRGGIPGTVVADHLDYELAFGPLGRLAHVLMLRRQIERAFAFRQRRVAELFARTPFQP